MIYKVGDRIVSKKVHPCGSNTWQVVRVGADLKLKCEGCEHTIIVDYDKAKKMMKKYIDSESK